MIIFGFFFTGKYRNMAGDVYSNKNMMLDAISNRINRFKDK